MKRAQWNQTKVGGQRVIVNEHGGRVTYIDDDCRHGALLAAAPVMLRALKVALAEIHNPGAFRSATGGDVAQYIEDHINIAEGR